MLAVAVSLVDWEMRSDRNATLAEHRADLSLVDWEMRSDRNWRYVRLCASVSLVDWEMRSDRNRACRSARPPWESSRLGNAL